jgi:hypothetical protein
MTCPKKRLRPRRSGKEALQLIAVTSPARMNYAGKAAVQSSLSALRTPRDSAGFCSDLKEKP